MQRIIFNIVVAPYCNSNLHALIVSDLINFPQYHFCIHLYCSFSNKRPYLEHEFISGA